MIEGIYANGKHSASLGFWIAERNIGIPKKRIVKKEIPYANGAYDFSRIAGEDFYEERELKYVFDIAEMTTREMEMQKEVLINWLCSISNEDIEDDFSPNYVFHGSYDSSEWEEDFGEGHLTVIFKCYPYRIAKFPTVIKITGSGVVVNTSVHKVPFMLVSEQETIVFVNGKEINMISGSMEISDTLLLPGKNFIEVKDGGIVQISYKEEKI